MSPRGGGGCSAGVKLRPSPEHCASGEVTPVLHLRSWPSWQVCDLGAQVRTSEGRGVCVPWLQPVLHTRVPVEDDAGMRTIQIFLSNLGEKKPQPGNRYVAKKPTFFD